MGLPNGEGGSLVSERLSETTKAGETRSFHLKQAAGRELRNFVAVQNHVGKFSVEEAFRITGRGWVLLGDFEGSILTGYRLDFGNGVVLHVSGIDWARKHDSEKIGLLVSNQFASRQELVDQNIIGATALILE